MKSIIDSQFRKYSKFLIGFIIIIVSLAIFDFLDIDEYLAIRIFDVHNWDINFYATIGILGLPVLSYPLIEQVNYEYLTFGNKQKYKTDSLKNIIGVLNILKNKIKAVNETVSFAQNIDIKNQFNKRHIDFIRKAHNKAGEVISMNEMFIEEKEIIDSLNEIMKHSNSIINNLENLEKLPHKTLQKNNKIVEEIEKSIKGISDQIKEHFK